ncbi:Signal transduction histidine-protein kinase/phosphatase DegS [Methylacidimicrobium cyclopophantes]|uniref:Signal transduction histidine-protein kinase/phosphatase DegS n=1 Tax=Methylacidimicrobium cyclopophantes TaxID=1041766 RepID=A0A5E6MBP5_9BACT|nr:PAS domain S-box protein [Methylacidimicrobium cyclopophantes]VVM06835.1 Signal transduction histidine-protein kinase/phosphatase DegS [Methylacidimicrobium cyclopophantes]
MSRKISQLEKEGVGRQPCGLSVAACLGSDRTRSFCSIAGWMHQMLDQMLEGMLVLGPDRSIEIVNRAAARIFGYRPDELLGQPLTFLLQMPEQISIPSVDFPHRPTEGASFDTGRHEALGRRKNGEVFPIELSVSQSVVEGQTALTILVRDLTERRSLEQALFEAESRERLRIGQDIHDSLCQMLIGIHYQAELLQTKLRERSLPESTLAARIGELVREASSCARALAQGLMPLAISPAQLPQALKELAHKTEERSGVACRFALVGSPTLRDAATALHLYQIAQESIHNAIRHGKPRQIEILLGEDAGSVYLRIADDGDGMRPKAESGAGLGLRSMRYRAGMIGGVIRFESKPKEGVIVLCTVPSATRGKEAKRSRRR